MSHDDTVKSLLQILKYNVERATFLEVFLHEWPHMPKTDRNFKILLTSKCFNLVSATKYSPKCFNLLYAKAGRCPRIYMKVLSVSSQNLQTISVGILNFPRYSLF